MTDLRILPAAERHLDALYEKDEDAAAEIETALDEIASDQRLFDLLCRRKFRNYDRPSYEVDVFEELYKTGLNMYRLKIWDYEGALVPYRVLYAYAAQKNVCYVLAVLPRRIAYDTTHPDVQRVVADYEQLGLPTY